MLVVVHSVLFPDIEHVVLLDEPRPTIGDDPVPLGDGDDAGVVEDEFDFLDLALASLGVLDRVRERYGVGKALPSMARPNSAASKTQRTKLAGLTSP
jgi:hypothetical protein